jgi:hypothetical protein
VLGQVLKANERLPDDERLLAEFWDVPIGWSEDDLSRPEAARTEAMGPTKMFEDALAAVAIGTVQGAVLRTDGLGTGDLFLAALALALVAIGGRDLDRHGWGIPRGSSTERGRHREEVAVLVAMSVCQHGKSPAARQISPDPIYR